MEVKTEKTTLINLSETLVRFNEVDPMGIVWHGNYIKYFEDGREAFGAQYGISYLNVYKQGLTIPLVSINCDYKKSLQYGDKAIIETKFIDSPAAKILFEYKIYRASDHSLAATGKSTQVFLNKKGELQLIIPDFIIEWKKQMGFL